MYDLWYEDGQPAIVRIITWARKMFEVLESVKRVAKGSQWVSIDKVALNRFSLTAFADYKLPQVLRHIGVLRYTGDLSERVDRGILLESGSPEEVEIRANTLWAVELIRRKLRESGNNLRAFEIDWILWNLGQEERFRAKPYHRTVTIFY